jgi:hypothetical protein
MDSIFVSFTGADVFKKSRSEYEEFLEENVLHIVNRFEGLVKNKAVSELGSTKSEYLSAINHRRNGVGDYTVFLDKNNVIANIIEKGQSPYDMKVGLLNSPKAKTSKSGEKYIDVPIKSKFNSSIIAKRFDVGDFMHKGNLPIRNVKSRALRKKIVRKGQTIAEAYRHKESVLVRGTVKTKQGQQGTALVFRRVSVNSDPLAFFSKGTRKRNFFKKAIRQLKQEIKWAF